MQTDLAFNGITSRCNPVSLFTTGHAVEIQKSGTLRADSGDSIQALMAIDSSIKWVAIGGGTGLATLLSGLREHLDRISLTAIVTVTDDGQSSGRLREEFGILPPGDVRSCLVALADPSHLMTRVFRHRFPGKGELGGHSLGNLIILGLDQMRGDMLSAIDDARELLGITARVLPSTLDHVDLVAMVGEREIRGQVAIKAGNAPIRQLSIVPRDAKALEAAVQAILEADLITLGPGSLFTSVIANLLINGIRDAVARSNGKKIYICNVMTEADETDGFSAVDHVRHLLAYGSGIDLDFALFNSSTISGEMMKRYAAERASALAPPESSRIPDSAVVLASLPLASEERFVRHDPTRLSRAILDLYNA